MKFKKGNKIRLGLRNSPEHNRKIGLANSISHKGVKLSADHRRKQSLGKKGIMPKNIVAGWNKGKKMPERSGAKCHLWKGGIYPKNLAIRKSLEYTIWRRSVFERDNYTCIWCGQKGGVLHADHIKSFSQFPELRFAIDNGRTLCKPCHLTTENYGRRVLAENEYRQLPR